MLSWNESQDLLRFICMSVSVWVYVACVPLPGKKGLQTPHLELPGEEGFRPRQLELQALGATWHGRGPLGEEQVLMSPEHLSAWAQVWSSWLRKEPKHQAAVPSRCQTPPRTGQDSFSYDSRYLPLCSVIWIHTRTISQTAFSFPSTLLYCTRMRSLPSYHLTLQHSIFWGSLDDEYTLL